MKKTITVFTTILFFLFTISAAFRPLSITSIHPDDHHHVSNDAVLTTTKTSEPNDNNDHQITATTTSEEVVSIPVEPETTTQTLIVSRPMNRPIRYSRSNQINRHFYNDHPRIPLRFVRRHPCRNYFHINTNNDNDNQPSVKSNLFRSDVVLASDDHVPSKWLEFKHEYGHHRHHHHHHHDDDDNEAEQKYEVDGDKLQMHHYHHRHHHQHKGVGFMRAIRKFLKHAFD